MKTQVEAIKNHLKEYGHLTSKEAFELYGCTRLASQIFSLRKQGWDIATLTMEGITRYGSHCSYAKYVLISDNIGTVAINNECDGSNKYIETVTIKHEDISR